MATVVSSKPAIPANKQSRSNHFTNRFLYASRLVAFLKKKLLATHDPKQIAEWIGDLNSDSFAVRSRATLALEEVGPAAKETIQKALEGNITLEFRRRAEGLLAKYERHATRDLRVVDVLEHMATAESRELLEILASAPTRPEVATAAALAVKRAR